MAKSKTKYKRKLTTPKLISTTTIAGVLTWLASNRLFIFIGNLGEDKIIEYLTTQVNRYSWGADGVSKSETIANAYKSLRTFVEFSWATIMANPEIAAIIIGVVIAIIIAIIGIIRRLIRKHNVKAGKVIEI